MDNIFINQGQPVEKFFEDVRGYWKSSVIITAVELDIFSTIGSGKTCPELASILNLNEDALERFLNALVNLNLLQKENNIFLNTYNASKYLVRNKPDYIGWIALYHKSRYTVWANLDKSLKTGKPVAPASYLAPDKKQVDNYARAMSARARLEVNEVLERINLDNCKTLLDLGGAPGTFATAFALKYPELVITVFDLPDMMDITQEITQGRKNIQIVEGNFDTDEIGTNFDAVFMSQILDSIGKAGVEQLFKKVYQALKKGGQIIIRDYILRDNDTEPEPSLFRSLNVLLTTTSGRLYSVEDYVSMLTKAGFTKIEFKQLPGPTDLVLGRKN